MTYRENTQEKLCQVRFAYIGLRRVKAWLNPEILILIEFYSSISSLAGL